MRGGERAQDPGPFSPRGMDLLSLGEAFFPNIYLYVRCWQSLAAAHMNTAGKISKVVPTGQMLVEEAFQTSF